MAEPYCDGLLAVRMRGVEPRPELYRGAAALKLTSGSTGPPKATFTTETELVVDTGQIVQAMGIGPEQMQIGAIPLSHAYGLGNVLMATLLQGTAVILREGFVPHALPRRRARVRRRRVPGRTLHVRTPRRGPVPGGWPPQLRTLVSAGARLEAATVRRFFDAFGIKIHSFYGTTEAGGIAYDDGDELLDETTVGHPLSRVRATLWPEEGAPPGGGRVHVAGPGGCRPVCRRGGCRRLVRGRRVPRPGISAASTAAIASC